MQRWSGAAVMQRWAALQRGVGTQLRHAAHLRDCARRVGMRQSGDAAQQAWYTHTHTHS